MTLRKLTVAFDKPMQVWDGFGFNYVETAQTRNYAEDHQEYGGFSYLSQSDRETILEMIFGEDGLKPGVIKMFLDSFHQSEPGPDYDFDPAVLDPKAYDHTTTCSWMTTFVREGVQHTKARDGVDLPIIITLYGPPGWMTKQKILRGRDLDPVMKTEVAKYLISWAKHLREVEGFNVRYLSLHNEGEDWVRWPQDGSDDPDHVGHDYNLFWSPEQVLDFLSFMPAMLKVHGMEDISITPGETSNWFRFYDWGYADAIADSPEALAGMGLITSHGFAGLNWCNRWYGDWRSAGIDILREKKPELHAWVTSTSWAKMDVEFINQIRNNIYAAKVNAIIPWAGLQVAGKWVGGDPNPGCAFKISTDGTYRVEPGYYFYKQVSRAGQPGMTVARVSSNETLLSLIAFAANGTDNPNAFVLLNMTKAEMEAPIEISGSGSGLYEAFCTSASEHYSSKGRFSLDQNRLVYLVPPRSVTTFFEI